MKVLDYTGANHLVSKTKTELANKENISNKVTTITDSSTDTQYPSAKAVAEQLTEIKNYIGYTSSDIAGMQADYENNSFVRLAGAVGKTQGADFNIFPMYGGMRRCNVSDDGTIIAFYGDSTYVEDGSNGQVMVYVPKFYYSVIPLKLTPQETGIGYHMNKANYYVTHNAKAGFKIHPAFIDRDGKEIDYFLYSAYEGCAYDVSASNYFVHDKQSVDFSVDKLSSIANVKPMSGLTQQCTRANVEAIAQNRGVEWHGDLIKQTSAIQLLMVIEAGVMNTQNAYGAGVTSFSDVSAHNCSVNTGGTSSLGNASGVATSSVQWLTDELINTYTGDGKVSVSYRGIENFYGNIFKFSYGMNIWGDGNMNGGQPYIAKNFSFAESKNSDNYEPAGFCVMQTSGYIKAMGYSEDFDWLMIGSQSGGSSSFPVGDNTNTRASLARFNVAYGGGFWYSSANAGAFYWFLLNGVDTRIRNIGARLIRVPKQIESNYMTNIQAWKQETGF